MARLTKEELGDRSRYEFVREELEIPELGGSVEVKTLSVKERNELPDIAGMKRRERIKGFSKIFSFAVSDPKLTPEEAEEFLGDLPIQALDAVMEKFGEMLGIADEEDAAETRRDFRSEND